MITRRNDKSESKVESGEGGGVESNEVALPGASREIPGQRKQDYVATKRIQRCGKNMVSQISNFSIPASIFQSRPGDHSHRLFHKQLGHFILMKIPEILVKISFPTFTLRTERTKKVRTHRTQILEFYTPCQNLFFFITDRFGSVQEKVPSFPKTKLRILNIIWIIIEI